MDLTPVRAWEHKPPYFMARTTDVKTFILKFKNVKNVKNVTKIKKKTFVND